MIRNTRIRCPRSRIGSWCRRPIRRFDRRDGAAGAERVLPRVTCEPEQRHRADAPPVGVPRRAWDGSGCCRPAAACLLSAVSAETNRRFTVDVFGTAQGLPSSAVLAVTQTRDGYLWAGTLAGLARFDGVQFAVFDENNTPGLNSSQIGRLYEDRQTNLWIGTENGGIAVVKAGKVTSVDIGQGRSCRSSDGDLRGRQRGSAALHGQRACWPVIGMGRLMSGMPARRAEHCAGR